MIDSFMRIYKPSAVVLLTDNSFLIVEDEETRYSIDCRRTIVSTKSNGAKFRPTEDNVVEIRR